MRIDIKAVGNLGNQMLQFMLLEALQRKLPTLQIGGLNLPEWNLERALSTPVKLPALRLIGQYVDLPLVERLFADGMISELEFAALGFRMGNYLPRCEYVKLFPRRPVNLFPIPAGSLLINIRGAETLADAHVDYGPIPIAFYRQLVDQTQLRPIFMGQLGIDQYSNALRNQFPEAVMLKSFGAMGDFDLMRSAQHIVTSVSTFSWLAAWLSTAETIHFPVFGMLNPEQRSDIDLLPIEDRRFRFYGFPVRFWTGSEKQFVDLAAPSRYPLMSSSELQDVLKRALLRLAPAARHYRMSLRWHARLHNYLGIGGRVGMRKRIEG